MDTFVWPEALYKTKIFFPLTRERNDGVHLHRVHWLPVGRDQDQIVPLDRQLRRTHGRERVDHPEPVSSAWCDREHFQGRVGHESGVRIPELALPVDQAALGVLARVDGQASWKRVVRLFGF